MYVGKAPGAYHGVDHLKGALLWKAPALFAKITLGSKGLPETNALAYYEH
jgi:hypothetical protein